MSIGIAAYMSLQKGTVQDVLDKHQNEHGINCHTTPFSEKEVLSLFRGICEGVRQFHTEDPPLALRDLKVYFVTPLVVVVCWLVVL